MEEREGEIPRHCSLLFSIITLLLILSIQRWPLSRYFSSQHNMCLFPIYIYGRALSIYMQRRGDSLRMPINKNAMINKAMKNSSLTYWFLLL